MNEENPMVEFDSAYQLLAKQYEELMKYPYEPRYEQLLKPESAYAQFDLSGGSSVPEVKDLEIRPLDFTHPDTTTLQQLNHNVFAASFRRHLLAREFSYANRMLSLWRSLAKDVEALYNNAFEFYFRQEEIRALKNADERRAAVHAKMKHVLALKVLVEKYYDKEGNYIVGEAVAYRNAVQAQVEDFDAQLASDNKHLDVFQKMRELGM